MSKGKEKLEDKRKIMGENYKCQEQGWNVFLTLLEHFYFMISSQNTVQLSLSHESMSCSHFPQSDLPLNHSNGFI